MADIHHQAQRKDRWYNMFIMWFSCTNGNLYLIQIGVACLRKSKQPEILFLGVLDYFGICNFFNVMASRGLFSIIYTTALMFIQCLGDVFPHG